VHESTVALADSDGTLSAQYTYDPYGTTSSSGYSLNAAQYTGRENDGTGLYYFRARYYNPKLQRFISEDPTAFRGGINMYAYAAGNPVSFNDPFGLKPSGPGGIPKWVPFLPLIGMALGPEGVLAGEAAEELILAAEAAEAVDAAEALRLARK
jgi:RHS repeat-associated protein